MYRITIRQVLGPDVVASVRVDGVTQTAGSVHLVDDGRDHEVEVVTRAKIAAVDDSGIVGTSGPFVARRAD
jgi:hypothetical protein